MGRWSEASGAHGRIERELVAERAAALRRIAERLEQLIAQVEERRRDWETAAGSKRRKAAEAHGSARSEASRYRWYLEVQREALGLRTHDRLDELYRVPGPIEG